MIADTPAAPYYAVIFTSLRTEGDQGYSQAAMRMLELAREQPGFLGVESAREDGLGITVSYWASEAAILAWKHHAEHRAVREQGRSTWYSAFHTRVCKVERDYTF
ncbi:MULTISPECIES: antibiotic biosynthesis monooxygenase [Pseudomonas]|jgi:heme-degrading monooxygenase HmoA|uniref:Antibiotic biosynthesis monooxygenase n=1 Tax=Pseudomonas rhodesiae TaxID=76760 RepID=A0A5C5NSW7_9PSED|nr:MULTISPECIES: antibiotic biosynthesis monooxygenase [Pseudomonas]MBB4811900.1 heme-degrading monooxygenase HmoA [Pseudomonas rhodesiae]MBI6604783.1 antibiotic biosynthesis monooxygenase [Pseudomonas sp. S4_EA_1b]MBI6623193.1 antibiotic biosynthesis monooxygenase [Pseudomonas rhodesiae]MBX4138724.1 antibiotic biosynthesis monooxygenase [Pseudomonas sp. S5F11]MDN6861298.1 antibiotic biosynthesis monooxygenase [Pseudomonas rhodesiae]